jgi:hypothetical protein
VGSIDLHAQVIDGSFALATQLWQKLIMKPVGGVLRWCR